MFSRWTCRCKLTNNEIRLMIYFISVKTKVQQRALAGEPYRGVSESLRRMIRGGTESHVLKIGVPTMSTGPNPSQPKPFLAGIARLYQGLGVSALRSITTHGLLWTFFDIVSHYIDGLPGGPER